MEDLVLQAPHLNRTQMTNDLPNQQAKPKSRQSISEAILILSGEVWWREQSRQ